MSGTSSNADIAGACPVSEDTDTSASFRRIFNPATEERIQFTDLGPDVLCLAWRSVPGGAITEHTHPNQQERFTITAGQAQFTINGEERVVGPGETLDVPAGVRHSEFNPGNVDIAGFVELRPALRTKQMFEAFAGLASEGKQRPPWCAKEPATARSHHVAVPPRKQSDLTPYLAAEPDPPAAMGAGENPRHTPLPRALG